MATHQYKCQELHDAIKAYTRKAMEVLRETVEIDSLPPKLGVSWTCERPDFFTRDQRPKPLWWIPLLQCQDKLSSEYQACKDVLQSVPALSRQIDTLVGTCRMRTCLQSQGLINGIAAMMLDQLGEFKFDSAMFESEYTKMEESLYCKEIHHERLTILYGLTSEQEIVFNEQLAIVSLSDDDVVDLLTKNIRLGKEDYIGVHHVARFAIRTRYSLPKVIGDGEFKNELKIEKEDPYINGDYDQQLIDLLRLYKTGPVYTVGIVNVAHDFFRSGGFGPDKMQPPYWGDHDNYKLTAEDASELSKLWPIYRDYQASNNWKFLSLALRRFSQAGNRLQSEDKLIDLMICCEALFLDKSEQGELSYRLAQRAAIFLEKTPDRRMKAFKFFKRVYSMRSDIVHGNTPKKPNQNNPKKEEDGERYTLEEALQLAGKPNATEDLFKWDTRIFNLSLPPESPVSR